MNKYIVELERRTLSSLRKLDLIMDEVFASPSKDKVRIFNLDAHISVIKDLSLGLDPQSAALTSWSISSHNRIVRNFYKVADPVQHIGPATWPDLGENTIQAFNSRYRKFLDTFDGFIACHPTSFAKIYAETGKPVLAMASTRYEHPFTSRKLDWDGLNALFIDKNRTGQYTFAANNIGDRDYFAHNVGFYPTYVPSLCDYTNEKWEQANGSKIVFARSSNLTEELKSLSHGAWQDARSSLGHGYSWRDLSKVQEVFVVPYNVSTMTLFELATMGVPVAVPTRHFMKQLKASFQGVLSELTFNEMLGLAVDNRSDNDPNNYQSKTYIDWWLDRADFYNSDLMPNIRQVDSFDDLINGQSLANLDDNSKSMYLHKVVERNSDLFNRRRHLMSEFIAKCRENRGIN